jgi:hypothetical protein
MFTESTVKNSNNCPTCKVVNTVCFWGEMPERKWKRPFVFVVSLLVLVGLTYWQFFSTDPEAMETGAKVISVVVGLMFLLGLISSVFGCEKCVAKVCGSA